MSEYRHFIAYIYEYEDGKKKGNAGFVKVSMRSGVCRMQLNIHSGRKELTECRIYGFFHEEETLYGILMGKAGIRGGICNSTVVTQEKVFLEQGFSFAQVSGLWIQAGKNENEISASFLTVWDERPVDGKKLITERPVIHQENTETITLQQDKNTENPAEGDDQELEAQNQEQEPTQMHSLHDRWEQFQYHYPQVTPFADNEITECIQIAPKDITFLGEKERNYAVCPFVRQKYMKYHHLLLGLYENGKYILAIPGLNRGIQDRNLAAMYGFPEFKETEDASFGYWYCFL